MHKKIQNTKQIIFSFLNFLLFILIIYLNKPSRLYAANNNWIEVSKTEEGIQLIDYNYKNIKDKKIIEVKTKYLKIDPITTKTIEENTYIMKINCIANTYKDISINGKKNSLAKWEDPNGDKLINDVISNSCKNSLKS